MKTKQRFEVKKLRNAILAIVASALGILLDFFIRQPLIGTFSAGFILCFVSFLFSFTSVREHGNNLIPKLAFWISFIGMWATILLTAQ